MNQLFVLTKVKGLQLFHILRQGAVILTAILMAHSSLEVGEIGIYEILNYIGFTLSFFWVAGLVQGLLTIYPQYQEREQNVLLFNAYLLFLSFSLGIFLLLYLLEPQALQFFAGKPTLPYYRLFIVYLLVNMPTYLLENLYLLKDRPVEIVLFGLFSFGGHLIVVLGPLFLGFDFSYSFIGLIVLACLKHVWLLIAVLQHAIPSLQLVYWKRWLWLSFPLILYAIVGGFNQIFDNWLVNFLYDGDTTTFAIFRYGARELPLAMAMASAFGTAMLPEVAANVQNSLGQIKTKSLKLLHILFPFSIVLVFTSAWLFPLIFSESFQDSVVIFNIFLLIIITRLIFARTILVGLQDNNIVLVFSILELICNVGCSFALAGPFGLAGIAMGTVLAHALEKVLLCGYLFYRYKIPVGQYTDLRWYTFYSVILIIGFVYSLS